MKRTFKTEVFLTIPLTLLVFILTCTSFVTQNWVSGEAIIKNDTDKKIIYNYGLFRGEKSQTNLGTIVYDLKSK